MKKRELVKIIREELGAVITTKPLNQLKEGVSKEVKVFMKKLNEQLKYLREDIKQSSTNDNWRGRLYEIISILKTETR